MTADIHWLLHTDGGLLVRILVGSAIFTIFAIVDFRRHRKAATKWREYTVLLISVALALVYGVINDQITVTISPEFFLYGKELSKTIGDNPPMAQLRWEAAKVGMKATWTAGLIFGVALLLANNPSKSLPRLRNRQLVMYVPVILAITAVCGVVGAWLGYHGYLTRIDPDFGEMVAANLYRPMRFMSAWGANLGGYVGGVIATIIAVAMVIARRSKHSG